MCQNEPGLCQEWDPSAGGNKALLFQTDALAPAAVPPGDNTLLPEACGVSLYTTESASYDEASDSWSHAEGRPVEEVLGQLGGEPDWLQNDETPACPSCSTPMGFVAQLDEGHDHTSAINFGGGYGYAFTCEPCGQAAFLWQCV
jgi:hypothetical protein